MKSLLFAFSLILSAQAAQAADSESSYERIRVSDFRTTTIDIEGDALNDFKVVRSGSASDYVTLEVKVWWERAMKSHGYHVHNTLNIQELRDGHRRRRHDRFDRRRAIDRENRILITSDKRNTAADSTCRMFRDRLFGSTKVEGVCIQVILHIPTNMSEYDVDFDTTGTPDSNSNEIGVYLRKDEDRLPPIDPGFDLVSLRETERMEDKLSDFFADDEEKRKTLEDFVIHKCESLR